ncbi:dephospho-CoA kinase [Chitinophaga ginsengisegetis]|uniref:Dephospho-CoA kinase n=1 Tax=Chitinophaga ginsengisegetis TaxID=393003 RepID=A0A1T5PCQ5_9BACT|nr:dephospho-CoA kinase [Chitinophaga ginsengisegetis]MDR6569351.1 dephospho-CoA kinase [Chitinophaga ginsengisegetis]MDR6648618.1 dephospho-CoA kinase [Chitinophaga ginsengisegetis]MDR6655434.1 dephospho-CoA kinase [Chitinophaga ginsengisegetis]SKD10168.1 dephospho-CoA kinase [Chitinophaga ginsengisegetis]
MLKIGITGGIGSGKSTVSRIFELLGVPVYYADDRAKDIMVRDPELAAQVKHHFGEEIYNADGTLNRKLLGNIVFNDKDKLALLNSLVHPATIRDSDNWAQQQTTPYVLKEAALLFETESFHHLDKVIAVFAPQPLRIHRVMKRDNVTRNEVLARMYKQIDETIKMRLSDYVIHNDEQHMVIPQVLALHKKFLELATAK